MQGRWAGPLHLPPAARWRRPRPIRTPRCGPGCAPTPPNTRAMGSGVPGRRCATTSAVRSTRRRSTGCGARRACRCRVHSPRKRAGVSSIPPVEADAPKVVWAIDFQFDSTIDGKAIKIASMIDEHTRESLLNLVERSITAERLVDELEEGVRRGRRPAEGAADGQRSGVGFSSAATVLRGQGRACPTFRRARRGTTATSNRSTTDYGRSASTATTGTPCSRPAWSSATSSTSTTTDTATRRWATARRPSTLRHAGTPTPLMGSDLNEAGSPGFRWSLWRSTGRRQDGPGHQVWIVDHGYMPDTSQRRP